MVSALAVCLVTQLRLILCDALDCILQGSSLPGILQARILEWVACPPSGDLPDLGIKLTSLESPALAGRFFTTVATWEGPLSPYV